MSITAKVTNLATAMGAALKATRGHLGDITGLTTTDKTSAVAAINELVGAIGAAGAAINDTTASTTEVFSSTKTLAEILALIDDASITATKAWSGNKVTNELAALKADILGSAGAAEDTLGELKTYIDALDTTDEAQIQAVIVGLANRVRFDAAQTLSPAEKVQALTNLGAASTADLGTNTAAIAALNTGVSNNSSGIADNATDIGDEANFDPVTAFNTALA